MTRGYCPRWLQNLVALDMLPAAQEGTLQHWSARTLRTRIDWINFNLIQYVKHLRTVALKRAKSFVLMVLLADMLSHVCLYQQKIAKRAVTYCCWDLF